MREDESGLVITFLLPCGASQEVTFKAKPLGLDFQKSMPLTVSGLQRPSEVQLGWVVTHLQGHPLAKDLRSATMQLIKAVYDLPDELPEHLST